MIAIVKTLDESLHDFKGDPIVKKIEIYQNVKLVNESDGDIIIFNHGKDEEQKSFLKRGHEITFHMEKVITIHPNYYE